MKLTIFLLMIVTADGGVIVKPEPYATQAECDARLLGVLAANSPNRAGVCIPPDAAIEIEAPRPAGHDALRGPAS